MTFLLLNWSRWLILGFIRFLFSVELHISSWYIFLSFMFNAKTFLVMALFGVWCVAYRHGSMVLWLGYTVEMCLHSPTAIYYKTFVVFMDFSSTPFFRMFCQNFEEKDFGDLNSLTKQKDSGIYSNTVIWSEHYRTIRSHQFIFIIQTLLIMLSKMYFTKSFYALVYYWHFPRCMVRKLQ